MPYSKKQSPLPSNSISENPTVFLSPSFWEQMDKKEEGGARTILRNRKDICWEDAATSFNWE